MNKMIMVVQHFSVQKFLHNFLCINDTKPTLPYMDVLHLIIPFTRAPIRYMDVVHPIHRDSNTLPGALIHYMDVLHPFHRD